MARGRRGPTRRPRAWPRARRTPHVHHPLRASPKFRQSSWRESTVERSAPPRLMREAISAHQRSSEIIRAWGGPRLMREAISAHQRSSEIIRAWEGLAVHQRSSALIRGHQRSSELWEGLAVHRADEIVAQPETLQVRRPRVRIVRALRVHEGHKDHLMRALIRRTQAHSGSTRTHSVH